MTAESPSQLSPDSNSTALLTARALFCERDDRVLFRDLNFEVKPGTVLQVSGSNGSGKTTLLRILCGLNSNFAGELLWRGEPLETQREEMFAALLYIGHRVGVNKVLTPLENLRWSCHLQSSVSDVKIMAALREVGLRGFEESQCFTLSAGQQQRVSLARLLLSPSTLWVLDEPFTTLDAKGVAQLESLLAQHAEGGGSVLVTTHHTLKVPGLQTLQLA